MGALAAACAAASAVPVLLPYSPALLAASGIFAGLSGSAAATTPGLKTEAQRDSDDETRKASK